MQQSTLKKRAISGMFWSFSGSISNQAVQLIIQIILARLLLPSDFGIIGMITIFIAVSQSLVDCGFANALIREANPTQEDYSTVFYYNFSMSAFLYAVLFFLSGPISAFFNEPRLVAILRAVALILVINSFGFIQNTILVKNLDFKTQTKINITAAVSSGIIAIVFALAGFGVWSLVIKTISMQIILAALMCITIKWVPVLKFNKSSFKKFFGFGWKLMASGVIDTLYNNLYYVVIGKVFSADRLGYYTNADKITSTATISLTTSVQKVTYPLLSGIKEDEEALRSAYRKLIKTSVYIIFPVLLGLAGAAETLVAVVFGAKWLPSAAYIRILCLGCMLYPLHSINLNILQVKGRSDLFLKLEIIKKAIGITLIISALYLRLGITGLLWAGVVSSYVAYFLNSRYSAALLEYSSFRQIKDISFSYLISAAMAFIVYFCGILMPGGNFLKLMVQVAAGMAFYICASRMLKMEEFYTTIEILEIFVKKIKTGRGGKA